MQGAEPDRDEGKELPEGIIDRPSAAYVQAADHSGAL